MTGRRPRLDLDTRSYFEIGDREDLGYAEKLAAYRRLADDYFETDRYHDFCASRLAHVDELVLDWVDSDEFDRLLVETVRATYPAHEQERFVAHLRGLIGQWVREQGEFGAGTSRGPSDASGPDSAAPQDQPSSSSPTSGPSSRRERCERPGRASSRWVGSRAGAQPLELLEGDRAPAVIDGGTGLLAGDVHPEML